eukprot:CAMPEP_0194372104 /NCGR_PEP_ID=MMETSP0174-20130528/20411_1 /TAXON_ID=216777 /ORGANISM="Proboscia alata, Strain PI-D3" /LENGTH=606 /DNA_ID=CAMNT_0039150421 /DNA_START=363 /DNA_END=2183 /DNA_ORIENTATION=-
MISIASFTFLTTTLIGTSSFIVVQGFISPHQPHTSSQWRHVNNAILNYKIDDEDNGSGSSKNNVNFSFPFGISQNLLVGGGKDENGNNVKTLTATRMAPGPTKWPVVGTLFDFLSRGGVDGLFEVCEQLYAEYGEIYSYSIMGDDEMIVCDPRLYETVMKNEGRFPYGAAQESKVFIDYHTDRGNEMSADALKEGEQWKEWRKKHNPDIFANGQSYLPLIAMASVTASRVLGKQINGGIKDDEDGNNTTAIGFEQFISRMAFDMFSAVMFGESPDTVDGDNLKAEDKQFVDDAQKAFTMSGILMLSPLEKVFKSDKFNEFETSMDSSFEFARKRTRKFIEIAKKNEEDGGNESNTGKCPVQGIAAATNAATRSTRTVVERLVKRGELSTDDIEESVGTLLMAGVDTTAYFMGWLYINLASNSRAQAELAKELHNVLKGEDLTTVEQMNALPYLRACLRETHRLTPVTPMTLIRRMKMDIDLGGYTVKAGQKLSLNLRAFPMNPEYVESPHEFRPERFMPAAVSERKGTPSEVIDHPFFNDPFGTGSKRICLGARVADAEIMCSAARLFHDWEIMLDGQDQEWTRKQGLMIKADPFPKMKVAIRTKW